MNRAGKNKGQVRIIEVIMASFVILVATTFINTFAVTPLSPTYETGELEKLGHNVLHDLDDQRLLARFVYGEEWKNLTSALMVTLPTDVYFDLTVYDLDGNVVNSMPIYYGDPEIFTASNWVASVTYIIPGYTATYKPRILILQLVRG